MGDYISLGKAMTVVLATWATCIAVFFGLGLLARMAIAGRSALTGLAAFACAWCGFAVSIALLQLWHLAWPVDASATGVLIAAGLCGLALAPAAVGQVLRDIARHRGLVVAFVLFAVWAANRGLGEGGYDDLGYEWHSVHWLGQYPIVTGLANLSHRIGFNNAHHLLEAAMNLGPLKGRVNHVFLGTFVLLLAAQVLWALGRLRRDRAMEPGPLFTLVLAAPCFIMLLFGMLGPMFSTLKADVLIIAAALAAVSLLVSLASHGADGTPGGAAPRDASFIVFTVVVLAAAMVAVKLSALVFGLGLVIAATAVARDRRFGIPTATLVAALAVATLLLTTWLARGAIVSGYPLYPSRAMTLPVSWRVLPEIVDMERTFITSWARDPVTASTDAQVLATRPWVASWLSSILVFDRFTTVLPAALLVAATPFAIRSRRRVRGHPASRKLLAGVAAISIASILFWFVSAPTTRFGYGFFWIAAGALLALAVPSGLARESSRRNTPLAIGAGLVLLVAAAAATRLPFPPGKLPGFLAFAGVVVILVPLLCLAVSMGHRRLVVAGLCLLAVSPLVERAGAHVLKGRMPELARLLFVAPGADGGFHGYTHQIPANPPILVTVSGLRLLTRIPARHDAPLLSAEDVFDDDNPYIRLRDPANIARGFEDERVAEADRAAGR